MVVTSEREYMSDVLYVPLDKLQCVLSIVGKNQSKINGLNVMNGIISIVARLIDLRMIISDELLMLCWEYYNSINDSNRQVILTMTCLMYEMQHKDIELICIAKKYQRYDLNSVCIISKKYSQYHEYITNRNSIGICSDINISLQLLCGFGLLEISICSLFILFRFFKIYCYI